MSSGLPSSSKTSQKSTNSTPRSTSPTVTRTTSRTLSTTFRPEDVAHTPVENSAHENQASDRPHDNERDIEKVGESLQDHRDPIGTKSGDYDTNHTHTGPTITEPIDIITSDDNNNDSKESLSHRIFDSITRHAGSRYVLLITVILILIWAVFGIVTGASDIWQIAMQNASSIQVYLTDILLIRQHHHSSRSLLVTLSKMQSRDRTYARLIEKIPPKQLERYEKTGASEASDAATLAELVPAEDVCSRSKKIFDESCRIVAKGLGSVWAYVVYWIGIFVWVGLGKMLNFSNKWQLYINSAVAVALTFTSIFLQNRQQQQEDTLDRALEYITKIDGEIEFRLRDITGDGKPNDLIIIQPPKPGLINRGIDWFAAMIGSFVGVFVTIVFLIVWLGVGPLLHYNADWWLILGTFTGLIGFIDGFVLRNIYSREADIVNNELQNSAAADAKVFHELGLEHTAEEAERLSWSSRISSRVGDWCALPSVCLASFLFVVALLVIATAMKWTTTAQLLCNTPTMIIEGFLLLVLIEAHCIADDVKGRHLRGVLERRLLLNQFLRDGMVKSESVVSDLSGSSTRTPSRSSTRAPSRASSQYFDSQASLKYPEAALRYPGKEKSN